MAGRRGRFSQRRKAVGFTQESLAEKLRVDRTTVVRWERGECQPQPWLRRRLASALDVSLDELDSLLTDAVVVDEHPLRVDTVDSSGHDGGDTTNRRIFTITAALAGLGVTGPLRGFLTSPEVPASIGMDHLRLITGVIDRFERADAALGGDVFCDFAMALHDRVGRWERECSYTRQVGDAMHTALGELESWIGWLALDAERRPESRRYLQDAIVRARLRDDPQLEVRAMTYLSLLIRDSRPRESLQCAEAALRIAAAWATPRLTALLYLRTMHAQAVLGDASAFNRELAKAKSQMERGPDEDDPLYIQFVTPTEVTGIEGVSRLALGQPDRATRAFRAITEHPDPAYRRNHGFYLVQLAESVRRQGDVAEAGRVALDSVPAVAGLHSQRTRRHFASLRGELSKHAAVPSARDFIAAYDEAVRH